MFREVMLIGRKTFIKILTTRESVNWVSFINGFFNAAKAGDVWKGDNCWETVDVADDCWWEIFGLIFFPRLDMVEVDVTGVWKVEVCCEFAGWAFLPGVCGVMLDRSKFKGILFGNLWLFACGEDSIDFEAGVAGWMLFCVVWGKVGEAYGLKVDDCWKFIGWILLPSSFGTKVEVDKPGVWKVGGWTLFATFCETKIEVDDVDLGWMVEGCWETVGLALLAERAEFEAWQIGVDIIDLFFLFKSDVKFALVIFETAASGVLAIPAESK